MPLPSSGPISFSNIQTEFGGTNPISLSEYYAGGELVPATASGTFGAVPGSGAIRLGIFFGTQDRIPGVDYTFRDLPNPPPFNTAFYPSASTFAVVWTGTQFLIGGGRGFIATSPDGITWTYQIGYANLFGTNQTVDAVVWSGTQFLVGGTYNSSAGSQIATSPDGITWTVQYGLVNTAYSNGNVKAAVWTGTQFLVVGAPNKVATSPDGVNWTNQTGLGASEFGNGSPQAAVWTGTQFLVGGVLGKIATSPDGITWTNRPGLIATTYSQRPVRAISWTGTQFLVVGGPAAATSPDGITWTYQGGLESTTFTYITRDNGLNATDARAISWDGTQFLVVGLHGRAATSPDGITWTNRSASLQALIGSSRSTAVDFAFDGGASGAHAIIWTGNRFLIGVANSAVVTSP